LSSLEQGQSLILYVSTSHTTVSGVLVQEKVVIKNEKKTTRQFLVYFISKAPISSKRYYSKMEKICYAIVMSIRKLHHYFEAHRVRVLTKQHLNDIFRNKDSSGIIRKWDMELSDHVIDFEKGSVIKS
jgi:hypothetical protein